MGLFLLAHIVDRLYARYHDLVSYFFAGLIVGSSRALLPDTYSLVLVPFFLLGFALVWWWSGRSVPAAAEGGTT
jgi:putative membrane protein